MSSDNSSRLLYTLKSRGPLATGALARALGITVVGTRQHLAKLHAEGLVAFDDQAGEVGRPKRFWRLTAKGHGRFPDTHGDEAEPDGSFLLIENHCPICAAAKTCQGFCRSELELFRAAFGAGTSVTRQEHLLSDGRRCAYRVTSLEGTNR